MVRVTCGGYLVSTTIYLGEGHMARGRCPEGKCPIFVTYNSSLLRRLDLCLEVRRWMKVAASLAVAPALDEVHAHRDIVVAVDGHAVRRMSVAALGLCASADASLVLATNLLTEGKAVSTVPEYLTESSHQ